MAYTACIRLQHQRVSSSLSRFDDDNMVVAIFPEICFKLSAIHILVAICFNNLQQVKPFLAVLIVRIWYHFFMD